MVDFKFTVYVDDNIRGKAKRYGDYLKAHKINPEIQYRPDGADFCYTDQDIRSVENPKMVQKLHNIFTKAAVPFNILVVMDTTVKRQDMLHRIEDYCQLKDIDFKLDPNAVNITLMSNVTAASQYMPLTPWIIAHRIEHSAIMSAANDGRPSGQRDLVKLLDKAYYTITGSQSNGNMGVGDDTAGMMLLLCTMASSRNMHWSNSLDCTAELFAQYIVCGKVTLNRAVTTITNYDNIQAALAARSFNYLDAGMKKFLNVFCTMDKTRFNKMIDELEDAINAQMLQMLHNMVGTHHSI